MSVQVLSTDGHVVLIQKDKVPLSKVLNDLPRDWKVVPLAYGTKFILGNAFESDPNSENDLVAANLNREIHIFVTKEHKSHFNQLYYNRYKDSSHDWSNFTLVLSKSPFNHQTSGVWYCCFDSV